MNLSLGSGAPASAGILFVLCLSVQLAARRWARRPPSKQPLRQVGAYAKRTHSLAIFTIMVLLGTFFALVLWLVGHGQADTSAITEAFSTSGWLAMGALLFAAPIGVVGALFVFEFEATRAARWLRLSAELLMSTPPVIVGGTVAWLAQRNLAPPHTLACFALGILLAPSVMRRALRVIANVPLDLREAALALGATRMQMVSQVIFATSRRQLLSAAFAALARTFGSTAPLILLMNVTSLPTYVFRHSLAGDTSRAAAAALVLLLIVSVFKALSIVLQPSEMRA
jgi:phosphate transport system permease protein